MNELDTALTIFRTKFHVEENKLPHWALVFLLLVVPSVTEVSFHPD